jgi:hypothetical protein
VLPIETTFRNILIGATPLADVGGTTISLPTASDCASGLKADMVSVSPSEETDKLDRAAEFST